MTVAPFIPGLRALPQYLEMLHILHRSCLPL
jgi:hypothetical protein